MVKRNGREGKKEGEKLLAVGSTKNSTLSPFPMFTGSLSLAFRVCSCTFIGHQRGFNLLIRAGHQRGPLAKTFVSTILDLDIPLGPADLPLRMRIDLPCH